MINVGRIVLNPRFAQSFTVYRKSGSWVSGRWTGTETTVSMTGTIAQGTQSNDLEQMPEGDRQKEFITVYTTQALYVSNTGGTSDEILWRGNRYRASQLFPYVDYGYYKVIAVKMDPETVVSP